MPDQASTYPTTYKRVKNLIKVPKVKSEHSLISRNVMFITIDGLDQNLKMLRKIKRNHSNRCNCSFLNETLKVQKTQKLG